MWEKAVMKESKQSGSKERKAGKILLEEEMRKAIQMLKGKEDSLDTDPFKWELKDIPGRFRKN